MVSRPRFHTIHTLQYLSCTSNGQIGHHLCQGRTFYALDGLGKFIAQVCLQRRAFFLFDQQQTTLTHHQHDSNKTIPGDKFTPSITRISHIIVVSLKRSRRLWNLRRGLLDLGRVVFIVDGV